MPKDIYLIRHAKSDWSYNVRDFDRPLNSRGLDAAPLMAERLSERNLLPELIVSSPARRALATAQFFANKLGIATGSIALEPDIYEASYPAILNIINRLEDDYKCAAIFGHNPGFTDLANYLTDEGLYNIPTCGIVHIHFADIDTWSEISGSMGTLVSFTYPKDSEDGV